MKQLLRLWTLLAVGALLATCGNSDDNTASAYVVSCRLEQSPVIGGTIASGEETASLRLLMEVAGEGSLGYTATLTGGDWISFSIRDFSETGRQRSATASVGENNRA